MFLRWVLPASICAAALGLVVWPAITTACPFCSAVSMTLGEELQGADVAVIARLAETPAPSPPDGAAVSLDTTPTKFTILEAIKGAELVQPGQTIDVVYFGPGKQGDTFLIMGIDPTAISWSTPLSINEAALEYVRKLPTLPPNGADRLAFFQEYFDSTDELLARDAHDEFARAPYIEVKQLKERMHHDELLAWSVNKDIPPTRRRLYLTMLGICGGPDDIPKLEELIRSGDPSVKLTLDALLACYLTLSGPDGMELVEELYFKKPNVDFTDTYSAIVALRFHGQEEQAVPRQRLLQTFRLMLNQPQYADLVIPDLARWEDWESMDRLVTLFKESNNETSWIRLPVIQFLMQCPLPEAKQHIEELAKIDPDAVKTASSFIPLGGAAPPPAPVPTDPSLAATRPTTEDGSKVDVPAAPQEDDSVAADPDADTEATDAEGSAPAAATDADSDSEAGSAPPAETTEESSNRAAAQAAAPAAAGSTPNTTTVPVRLVNGRSLFLLPLGAIAVLAVIMGVLCLLFFGIAGTKRHEAK